MTWTINISMKYCYNKQNAIQVKAIRATCCSFRACVEQNGIPALCFDWLAQPIMQHCTRQQNVLFRLSWNTLDALQANSILQRRILKRKNNLVWKFKQTLFNGDRYRAVWWSAKYSNSYTSKHKKRPTCVNIPNQRRLSHSRVFLLTPARALESYGHFLVWQVTLTLSRCLNPEVVGTDYLGDVPVTLTGTALHFRNVYCAACNFLPGTHIEFWLGFSVCSPLNALDTTEGDLDQCSRPMTYLPESARPNSCFPNSQLIRTSDQREKVDDNRGTDRDDQYATDNDKTGATQRTSNSPLINAIARYDHICCDLTKTIKHVYCDIYNTTN